MKSDVNIAVVQSTKVDIDRDGQYHEVQIRS